VWLRGEGWNGWGLESEGRMAGLLWCRWGAAGLFLPKERKGCGMGREKSKPGRGATVWLEIGF